VAVEMLGAPEKSMDVPRAKAISGVADSIIESTKVELQFYELVGHGEQSKFLDQLAKRQPTGQMLTGSSSQEQRALE
jgi:hypothetical protein